MPSFREDIEEVANTLEPIEKFHKTLVERTSAHRGLDEKSIRLTRTIALVALVCSVTAVLLLLIDRLHLR